MTTIMSDLIAASLDPTVSSIEFVPLVIHALETDDTDAKDLALDVFIRKTQGISENSFEQLTSHIMSNIDSPQIRDLLQRSSRIGYFYRCTVDDITKRKTAQDVCWLIQKNPRDFYLSMHHYCDFEGNELMLLNEAWQDALRDNSKDLEVLSNVARFLERQSPEEAKRLLKDCIKLDPDNESYTERIKNIEQMEFIDQLGEEERAKYGKEYDASQREIRLAGIEFFEQLESLDGVSDEGLQQLKDEATQMRDLL